MRKSEGRPAPRQPVTAPSDATSPAPLESLRRAREQRARVGLNLFWRTFFLLALLLVLRQLLLALPHRSKIQRLMSRFVLYHRL